MGLIEKKEPVITKTAVTAMMAVGIADLMWIAAAAVLGKEGFKAVRYKNWKAHFAILKGNIACAGFHQAVAGTL